MAAKYILRRNWHVDSWWGMRETDVKSKNTRPAPTNRVKKLLDRT
jgi:hypothetical protein